MRLPETPNTATNLIVSPVTEGKQGNKGSFLSKLGNEDFLFIIKFWADGATD